MRTCKQTSEHPRQFSRHMDVTVTVVWYLDNKTLYYKQEYWHAQETLTVVKFCHDQLTQAAAARCFKHPVCEHHTHYSTMAQKVQPTTEAALITNTVHKCAFTHHTHSFEFRQKAPQPNPAGSHHKHYTYIHASHAYIQRLPKKPILAKHVAAPTAAVAAVAQSENRSILSWYSARSMALW